MKAPTPILLAMADRADRARLALALRFAGHAVLEARSVREALRFAHETRPQLAIIDDELPDRSGEALTAELRGLPGCSAMPVVLVVEAVRRSVFAREMVTRPIAVDELLRRIHSWVQRSAARLLDDHPEP